MATHPPLKDANSQWAHSMLDLSTRVIQCLNNREDVPQALENEIDTAIHQSFPISAGAATAARSFEFDRQGCALSNAAANLSSDQFSDNQPNGMLRLPALLRVFAFLLIETANHNSTNSSKTLRKDVRCFKVALRACKCCLDRGELEIALKVLETCSDYVAVAENDTPIVQLSTSNPEGEQRAMMRRLTTEFHLLRIAHAWKWERLDLADFFFNKLSMERLTSDLRVWGKAAELFSDVGRWLLKRRLDQPAMTWLDRALALLNTERSGERQQHPDWIELRLSAVACIVECLLRERHVTSLEQAQMHVNALRNELGLANRLAVQIMQLRILLVQDTVPISPVRESILLMVRATVLNDETFKLIMQCIHLVKKTAVSIAHDALAELLDVRLLEDPSGGLQAQTRIEKVVVTYTLFAASETDVLNTTGETIINLHKILDSVAKRNNSQFSSEATHAAQALMWRAANAAGPEMADRWCTLLRHRLFDCAGQVNKDKIARHVLICRHIKFYLTLGARKKISIAIEASDFEKARQVFFEMPTASQNHNLSRYLAFKLALASNDSYLATQSLQQIAEQSKDDQSILYACVLAAQESGMQLVAVAALQAILDRHSPKAHLPSLLRCTARLLVRELDSLDANVPEVMSGILRVFENARLSINALKNATGEQWRNEVQWWSKNAYNLSLEHCTSMMPDQLARLLRVCVAFIDADPSTEIAAQEAGLKRRKAHCHFLCATALIVQARASNQESDFDPQSYLQAQQEISAFKTTHKQTTGKVHEDLNNKAFELLKFNLECILHLKQWDHIDEAVQACLECQKIDQWDTLADIVLIIRQQPGILEEYASVVANMNKLLDKIINQTWQQDKDITKASRWLRLSFSMDLNQGKGGFAYELVRQAAAMARKGCSKDDAVYPETELQWLAGTAFNKALDLLSAGEEGGAKNWIDAALELARYAADNGALHANLTQRNGMVMARLKQGQP